MFWFLFYSPHQQKYSLVQEYSIDMSSYLILELETLQMCQPSFYHEEYIEIFLNVNTKPGIYKNNIFYDISSTSSTELYKNDKKR